jgi:RHS repeat-associated protein
VLNRSNRIAETKKGTVSQGTYLYDAFERLRVRTVTNQTATANNGTTHYVWDIFGQIIAEVNGATGVTLRETVYLDGMPLAAIDAVASPKKTYAVHTDHLNRPIMLTDSAKTNVWWARYEPFGRVHATGGTLTQNLGLPGQWFQLENGLAYNWHRHYDPTTGRYTTADPLGFVDGPSIYAYARSNPQRFVDPSGLRTGGVGNYTPRPGSGAEQCGAPPSWLLNDMRLHRQRGGDICHALRQMRDPLSGWSWTRDDVRQAEKFFGCRGSSLDR